MRTAAAVVVVLMLVGCGGGGGSGESNTTQQAGEQCFGLDIHGALGWGPCDEINTKWDSSGLWDRPPIGTCLERDAYGNYHQVACSK